MEPIPESRAALSMLSVAMGKDLLSDLHSVASDVVALVPDCVGMSIAHFDNDVTFTLLATSERLRLLDAAQYLEGGPCELAAATGRDVQVADLLDERRWQLLALAGAAQGVRSSLSLPLRSNRTIYGSANFYASTHGAFTGHEAELAAMFGAAAGDAVANADLSMRSVGRAGHATTTLKQSQTIDEAIGVLSVRKHVSVDEAEDFLYDAANRAGVPPLALAELVLRAAPEV